MAMPMTLSASAVGSWLKCPQCWAERYISKDRDQPTGNMLFGRVIAEALECLHRGNDWEVCLTNSYTRNDLIAREKFKTSLVAGPDVAHELMKEYVDGGIYHGTPEKKFKVNIKGIPVPVLGFMDLQEEEANGHEVGVVEFKTTSARWDQQRVDSEIQGTFYWCAFWTMYRRLPHMTYVVMDIPARQVNRYETYRSREDCLALIETVDTVWNQMRLAHGPGGAFPGFCDRHKIKTARTLRNNALVLPTLDLDS